MISLILTRAIKQIRFRIPNFWTALWRSQAVIDGKLTWHPNARIVRRSMCSSSPPSEKQRRCSAGLALLMCGLTSGCLFFHGQRYHDFVTRVPLPQEDVLILGFMGGRESWNNANRGVRKLALKLRSMEIPGVHVETVENKKRDLAIQLIRNAFDRDQNGLLEWRERQAIRLILYGQSFGGAAVIKLAGQLDKMSIPVMLTVQIDSVGIGDEVVPSNVRRAANLFQSNGLFVRGESRIRPADPGKTEILGNLEFDYSDKEIDLSSVSWLKRIFRTAHTKMDFDPEVWGKVEELILNELHL